MFSLQMKTIGTVCLKTRRRVAASIEKRMFEGCAPRSPTGKETRQVLFANTSHVGFHSIDANSKIIYKIASECIL